MARLSARASLPLAHPPGHARVDFGEAVGIIGGARVKLHVFCLDLPHSAAAFVKAYPAEATEAFLDGHASALAFLGGVPRSILGGVPRSILGGVPRSIPYDSTKLAVARILPDGTRERTAAFTRLISHYTPSRTGSAGRVRATTRVRSRRW